MKTLWNCHCTFRKNLRKSVQKLQIILEKNCRGTPKKFWRICPGALQSLIRQCRPSPLLPVQLFLKFAINVRPHYAARQIQHTAALPHGKSCSAYAANAIASTWKTKFLPTFRLQRLEWGRWTLSDFFLKLADTILKPLTHHMPRSIL